MDGASRRRPWETDSTMPTNTDTENEKEPTDADKNPLNSPSPSPYSENENEREEAEDDPILPYLPHEHKSLAGIAVRSFALGIALAAGLIATFTILLATSSPLWRLPFFAAALALFHFLEFWTTATYNTRAAEIASFLLTSNWPAYAIAHTVAALECLVVHTLWPGASWTPLGPGFGRAAAATGLALVVVGQAVRSVAMIHAGRSFNHLVQNRRREDHVLVTSGVYGVLRHPSYFGFFWWALGTQMVMGNVVSFVGYAVVLWRFFSSRIRHEEAYLVAFFGSEYVDYRRRVRTRIPFVP
ncbi:Isoprenylcysteine carboxyl methyltransferase family-domain-containing protein [Chaetomium fimeti]|uniref:Protein-S-isoprenylcysteine O-methyltransferase n=1 Tax=Chaetomium fimeti TaxID=1854472 RepID=A0AAE0HGE8_9PEZI|nr:Isoprenylcysteine carboxyl methyltransferase family-domain-containing protein [Chaetomium fimeti]